MKKGERWIAKGEPEFVVEVISTDFVQWDWTLDTKTGTTSHADPEGSFRGRTISFPKNPGYWTNKQREEI